MRSSLLAALLASLATMRCWAGAAGASGRFLNIAVGARQAGMAQAATGLADDVNGFYYNPAGLRQLVMGEASFMHSQYAEGIGYEHLAYGRPTARHGTWAGDAAFVHYGSIASYDENNAAAGTVSASDLKLGLAWAGAPFSELLPALETGASAKFVRESLASYSAQAYALDLGLRYPILQLPRYSLSAGLAARNLGTKLRFASESADLPRTYAVGLGFKGLQESLAADLDVEVPQYGSPSAALGAELWVMNRLAWRLGYRSGADLGPGIYGGVGMKLGAFQVDYAITPFGAFGYVHRVGILVRFGGMVDDLYERGLTLMSERHYAEAVEAFTRLLTADPSSRRAVLRLRECQQALSADMAKDKQK